MEDKLPRKIDKPWGFELLFAHTTIYAGKLLFIKAGHRFSLQYHKEKDETLFIHNGKAIIELEGEDGQIVKYDASPGCCFRVTPGTKHRVTAIEDTTIFEVSTTELDDVERLEDDFGRIPN